MQDGSLYFDIGKRWTIYQNKKFCWKLLRLNAKVDIIVILFSYLHPSDIRWVYLCSFIFCYLQQLLEMLKREVKLKQKSNFGIPKNRIMFSFAWINVPGNIALAKVLSLLALACNFSFNVFFHLSTKLMSLKPRCKAWRGTAIFSGIHAVIGIDIVFASMTWLHLKVCYFVGCLFVCVEADGSSESLLTCYLIR